MTRRMSPPCSVMKVWRMEEAVIKELVMEEVVMKLMDKEVVIKVMDEQVIKELVILE